MTESNKRFLLPGIVITILAVVLVLIGWLAFTFFDALARKTVTAEPFFGVSTVAVHRASIPAPQSHEQIILSGDDVPTADTSAPGTGISPYAEASHATPTPAACIHFGDTITSRDAWHNPLEHTAVVTPNRVTVSVISPTDLGSQQP